MATEENRGASSTQHQQQQPNVGAKTELYRYSASSYTTKSNEGMWLLRPPQARPQLLFAGRWGARPVA